MIGVNGRELVRLDLGPNHWLEGDCCFPPASRERKRPEDFAVIYIHGLGSVRGGDKAKSLATECAKRNWVFAAFDFRGHGKSSSQMRDLLPSNLLQDLDTVREFLRSRGVRRLCLVGSSMGGWAAAWFALGNPESVAACALIAPAFQFPTARWDRLTKAEREAWRRAGVVRVKNEWVDVELGYGIVQEIPLFPHERLLENFATPTLIFHGLQDDVVPAAHSLAFVEKAKFHRIELHFYKDGDHRLNTYRQELAEAACRFFARVLDGTSGERHVG